MDSSLSVQILCVALGIWNGFSCWHHKASCSKNQGTCLLNMSTSSDVFKPVVFRWDISVICLTVVLKLAVTVFISPYFQTFWPNWLNFFRSFKKMRSMIEKNRFKQFTNPLFFRCLYIQYLRIFNWPVFSFFNSGKTRHQKQDALSAAKDAVEKNIAAACVDLRHLFWQVI